MNIKRSDNDTGERKTWKAGECGYCHEALGAPHKSDCVIPQKTVVIRASFEMVYSVPRGWDKDQIEFHLNESSACMSRLVEQLMEEEEAVGEGACFTCHRKETRYLRDATEADHDRLVPFEMQDEYVPEEPGNG